MIDWARAKLLLRRRLPSRARSSRHDLLVSTLPPLALAPVGSTTKVFSGTAEVGTRAAKSSSTLLVDNGPASLAVSRDTRGLGRDRRLVLRVALSVASLASRSAVEGLVLDVVLGAAGWKVRDVQRTAIA